MSQQNEYIYRINKVVLFIEAHLDEPIDLGKLASEACYSPFHFHRVFSALVDETPKQFINRLRLERIASALLKGQADNISDLSVRYGFQNLSSFSRAFKRHFGISATEFQNLNLDAFSKIRKTESKNGQTELRIENYFWNVEQIKNWMRMNATIEIKQMPEIQLAAMRHVGPFDQIGQVYSKLFGWAGPKGLLANPELKTATVYHDDPSVTDISKLRQSAGITVPHAIEAEGEIIPVRIKAGKFAVGRFEITDKEFGQAWNSMCIWVEESGYKENSENGQHYELYHNDHTQHPERKFILDICIPVK